MSEQWEKRRLNAGFSVAGNRTYIWYIVDGTSRWLATCASEADADRILADHDAARKLELAAAVLERARDAASMGGWAFNLRVDPERDPENDTYALVYDNTGGDRGGPMLESYFKPLLEALLPILNGDALTAAPPTSEEQR